MIKKILYTKNQILKIWSIKSINLIPIIKLIYL